MIRARQDMLDVDGRSGGVAYYVVNTVHIGILAAGEKITITVQLLSIPSTPGNPFSP